jgi:hypothetical protein
MTLAAADINAQKPLRTGKFAHLTKTAPCATMLALMPL